MTRIEQLITQLVQQAPELAPETITALAGELRATGQPLALSIVQVLELVCTGAIDAGVALPALAMACGTLVDPRLSKREHEAARFEIETLMPVPEASKNATPIAVPDVPLSSLRRR